MLGASEWTYHAWSPKLRGAERATERDGGGEGGEAGGAPREARSYPARVDRGRS